MISFLSPPQTEEWVLFRFTILYRLIVLIDVLRLASTADVVPLCTASGISPHPVGRSLWPEDPAVFAGLVARLAIMARCVTWVPWLVRCSGTVSQAPITIFTGINDAYECP